MTPWFLGSLQSSCLGQQESQFGGGLAEFEAADFAGGGAGEFADEFEFAGAFVGWKASDDEVEESRGKRGVAGKARAEHDPSDRLGEAMWVRLRGDGDFGDGFVLEQQIFNFHRADPNAAHLEHVVGAAGEPVVAVLILIKLIAGAKPVAVDGLLGAFVTVPVSGARGVAFEPKGSDFAGGNGMAVLIEDFRVVAGDEAATGAVAHITGRIGNEDVQGFGGPDAVENIEAEAFREAITQDGGQGFARGDREANTGEIKFAAIAPVVEQRGEIGGHGKEERGAMALNDGEDILRRWRAGAEDGSAADGEGKIQGVAEAVGEEEFCGAEETVGFGDFQDLRGVAFGGHDHVVLQVDTAFGEAGASGGVEPEGSVVFASGRGGELRVAGREKIGERNCAGRRGASDEQVLQERQTFTRDLQNEVGERVADNRDAGTRVVEKIFIFVGAEQHVERDGDGADLDGAEKAVSEFGNVGKQEQDALFHAHAQGIVQAGTKAVHALAELRVGDALVATLDGDAVPAALGEMTVNKKFGGVEFRLLLTVEGGHGRRV